MNVDDIHRLIKKFHFKIYNNSLNQAINQNKIQEINLNIQHLH
jgi:hypothetical protein